MLFLTAGSICNNMNETSKESCTKRIVQCATEKNYIKIMTNGQQEELLNYCVTKELGIKDKNGTNN